MPVQHRMGALTHFLAIAGGAAVLAAALTACGGSSSNGTSSASSPTPSSTPSSAAASAGPMPTGGAAAKAAIKQNWTAFFNAKTPTSRRVQLIEHGQELAQVLQAQASSSLASSASAQVDSVTLTSPTQATVKYTVLIAGNPVLRNQTGVAVYRNGVWQVGDASFCALLKMENSGSSAALPSVCQGT
jgi:ABC-type glycerol-3-phosphate transport system substrate-binding protein